MSTLKALIFDVDGTLADTERDGHRVAFNRAFSVAGLSWDWTVPLYGELLAVTGGKERIHHFLEHYANDFQKPADLAGFVRQLHEDKTRIYTEMLATGMIPLRPGVRRLLEEARRLGLRLAIATTTTPANVTALLGHANPAIPVDWFEVIAAGEIVSAKKPAPDIYEYTMGIMNLLPHQCIAIEDSENGLRSARAAQLTTIITVNEYTRDQNFYDAALTVDHMGEAEQPFTVLAGSVANTFRYLNIDLLRNIHAAQ